MSVQLRVKKGKEFEKKICNENNYLLDPKSPTINWSKGMKNIPTRIIAIDFNAQKLLDLITFDDINKIKKYDAINEDGFGVEIKNIIIQNLKKVLWFLSFLKLQRGIL